MADKNPLTSINLSGNKLVLGANGKWYLESSDLDQATLEIETLVTEKEQLASSLSAALQQIEALKAEVREVNGAKSVLLEMVGPFFSINNVDCPLQHLVYAAYEREATTS
ncbi:hypothetical protein EON65_03570 [archaeon]|nr:MAG: hypothetical protein EON65_03570 [archaeon]